MNIKKIAVSGGMVGALGFAALGLGTGLGHADDHNPTPHIPGLGRVHHDGMRPLVNFHNVRLPAPRVPGGLHTLSTPPVGVTPPSASTPGVSVTPGPVSVPPVNVTPPQISTPGLNVPPVSVPPVNVTPPAVSTPGLNVTPGPVSVPPVN